MKNKIKFLEGYSYRYTLDCLSNKINNYIDEKGYKEWYVVVVIDGLKAINASTGKYAKWNIFDCNEDDEIMKRKIIKFLDLKNNTK